MGGGVNLPGGAQQGTDSKSVAKDRVQGAEREKPKEKEKPETLNLDNSVSITSPKKKK